MLIVLQQGLKSARVCKFLFFALCDIPWGRRGKKEKSEAKQKTLPIECKEYTKGQLYEAGYILEIVEKIIYDNQTYNH